MPFAVGQTSQAMALCKRRGCRSPHPVFPCVVCGKPFHEECYLTHVLKKQGGSFLEPLAPGLVACTKACHSKALTKGNRNRRLDWGSDGALGLTDPRNSERILLDWMCKEGNCSRFRGKNNRGVTKMQFAQRLAEQMIAAHVKVKRTAKQVLNKIEHLEKTFKAALSFSQTETGQGLQEGDAGGFDDALLKICPHFHELHPIMIDRAAFRPKALSDNFTHDSDVDDILVNNEDDEEQEDGNGTPASMGKSPSSLSLDTGNTTTNSIAASGVPAPVSKKKARRASISSQGSATKRGRKSPLFLGEDVNEKIKALTDAKLASVSLDNKSKMMRHELERWDLLGKARDRGHSDEMIRKLFPSLGEVLDAEAAAKVAVDQEDEEDSI